MKDLEFHSLDPQPSLLQTMINQAEKDIELTTLRERVRELEEKNAHSLEGMHKLGDLVNEGVARIRELEEAMPHPFTLREIAKGINNECYATGLDAPTLEMMADRIEKVITKQP